MKGRRDVGDLGYWEGVTEEMKEGGKARFVGPD
jgi:hypothetical protein